MQQIVIVLEQHSQLKNNTKLMNTYFTRNVLNLSASVSTKHVYNRYIIQHYKHYKIKSNYDNFKTFKAGSFPDLGVKCLQ